MLQARPSKIMKHTISMQARLETKYTIRRKAETLREMDEKEKGKTVRGRRQGIPSTLFLKSPSTSFHC